MIKDIIMEQQNEPFDLMDFLYGCDIIDNICGER